MVYSTTEINRNFLIKVYGRDDQGKRINCLVGVSGLIRLIGEKFADKFSVKAFNCKLDKFVAKLRRGIKITFYYR